LFLPLNRQERVVADLCCCIAGAVRILECHETLLASALCQLLVLIAFDQIVDAALAQQVRLGFLFRARLSICRSLVHPVHAIYPLLPSCFL
jgi:hypothetical protein